MLEKEGAGAKRERIWQKNFGYQKGLMVAEFEAGSTVRGMLREAAHTPYLTRGSKSSPPKPPPPKNPPKHQQQRMGTSRPHWKLRPSERNSGKYRFEEKGTEEDQRTQIRGLPSTKRTEKEEGETGVLYLQGKFQNRRA